MTSPAQSSCRRVSAAEPIGSARLDCAMDDETADGFTSPSLHGRPAGARADAIRAVATRVTDRWRRRGRGRGRRRRSGRSRRSATSIRRTSCRSSRMSAKDLTAAVDAERALLATVDAALAHAHGATKRLLRAIRDDHAEHLAALTAAVRDDAYPAHPFAARRIAVSRRRRRRSACDTGRPRGRRAARGSGSAEHCAAATRPLLASIAAQRARRMRSCSRCIAAGEATSTLRMTAGHQMGAALVRQPTKEAA